MCDSFGYVWNSEISIYSAGRSCNFKRLRSPGWQRKIKCGSLPNLPLDPDPTVVEFDNALHNRQTDARAVALRIQLIKKIEYPFMIFWRYPHAIIPDKENPAAILLSGTDFDQRVH